MGQEEVGARVAELRRQHQIVRADLRRWGDALEALELRQEGHALRALVAGLRAGYAREWPAEEAVAREMLGPASPSAARLTAAHRELDDRLRRLERQVADPTAAADDLWREGLALMEALTCHLCRLETRLLPLIGLAEIGGTASARPAIGFGPCRRPVGCS
jgi:hypothetical protein